VLYTDGLVEARDSHGREFGIEQICALVESKSAEAPTASVSALMEKVRAWTPVQQDDITVLALRRLPPVSGASHAGGTPP
jgi:serine phosphatase RsbU (regulator of sigma subunit)